jgi:hypothetical protein
MRAIIPTRLAQSSDNSNHFKENIKVLLTIPRQSNTTRPATEVYRVEAKTSEKSAASGLLQLNFRVDGLEFDPRVVDLHLPIDASLG